MFKHLLTVLQIPRRIQQPVQSTHQHQHQHHHHHHEAPTQHQSQQQVVYAPSAHNAAVSAPSERQAHDQFLEQNAWARPQQSAMPSHGTPNLTHTPDWVDQPAGARHIMRNLTGPGQRTGSPFATPVSGKRAAAFASDGDISSSALAAPPSNPRTLIHGISTGSPLQVAKQRQPNGHSGERELTGFRNISNISSTSTIDAPLSAEKLQDNDRSHSHESLMSRHLPALNSEVSAPQQPFETSQMHRHPNSAEGGHGKDVYANPGFRPAEGAFGTPTSSLMSGRAAPPPHSGQM